jgi:hypothetical protein
MDTGFVARREERVECETYDSPSPRTKLEIAVSYVRGAGKSLAFERNLVS